MKSEDETTATETASADRTPEVLSFRAVVVMTQRVGGPPTLKEVESALLRSGIKFVMPADPSGIIVISLNDAQ